MASQSAPEDAMVNPNVTATGIELDVLHRLKRLWPGARPVVFADASESVEPESPEEAFEQLGKTVWRFLFRSGVARSHLDDATQDVFVVVVRRWEDFRGSSSRQLWILGIASNVANNYRRRQVRPIERTQPLSEVEDPTRALLPHASRSPHWDPFDSAAAQEANALLQRFLGELSEQERSLFVLVDLEGFKVPEVAPAMKLTSRKAHVILERVRRHFDAEIERHHRRQTRAELQKP